MTSEGLFTKDNLRVVLGAVCARIGMDDHGARLLRFTNNAVFRLERHPVVVRIVASMALRHRVEKVVTVASWLAEHDIPAIRLMPGLPQPIEVGEHLATVWQTVPDGGEAPRARDLAVLLRRLHTLPPPPFSMPAWDPLDDVRRRIGEAHDLDDELTRYLLERCDTAEQKLADLRYLMPRTFLHGDAHLGNLIPSPSGPVLCDFDSSCVGPPEWDLTPLAVAAQRFGDSSRYRELASVYGLDVTGWSGFPVLREVRELKLVTTVLPIMDSRPEVRPEVLRRLHDFRTGDTTARWSRY